MNPQSTPDSSSNLSEEQATVVRAALYLEKNHNLLVIAGPGSGKTRTLIAALLEVVKNGAHPGKVAAISFTNNSAAELRVRLQREGKEKAIQGLHQVHVSTFHSWVADLKAKHVEPWRYPPVHLKTASLAVALHLFNPDSATRAFTRTEVSAAERHMEGCETFDQMRERNFNKINESEESKLAFEHLVKATEALIPELAKNQLHTFGTLMAEGKTLAGDFNERDLEWLFIDEAQDLNRPQMEFVFELQQRTGCRLFVIADDDQGIYKFRGASSEFLNQLREKKDEQGRSFTQELPLTINYRSTPAIVEACKGWIEPNWKASGVSAKTLVAKRTFGLPVVVLSHQSEKARASHAAKLIDGLREKGLISVGGDLSVLAFSPKNISKEVKESGFEYLEIKEPLLPKEVLRLFLNRIANYQTTDEKWHLPFWREFADEIAKTSPSGHSGLGELYAIMEVFRRLSSGIKPSQAQSTILDALGLDSTMNTLFVIGGEKPELDYLSSSANHLSMHSSKGLEFRSVWVTRAGYTFKVQNHEEREGQPNFLKELFFGKQTVEVDKADAKQEALLREKRRLLYVAMSRATDLLMISAPKHITPDSGTKNSQAWKQSENNFHEKLFEALPRGSYVKILLDSQVDELLEKIDLQKHRHPSWTPPVRYQVESFTSMYRMSYEQEELVSEIPEKGELPYPQSYEAFIGDQFHRIMAMLVNESKMLEDRLSGKLDDQALVSKVCSVPTRELKPLFAQLQNFFSDNENRPWEWLINAEAERRFNHVPTDKENLIVKGFVDLIQWGEDGKIIRIVDWKTGKPDSEKHRAQLELYAHALHHDLADKVELVNYYPSLETGLLKLVYPSCSKSDGENNSDSEIKKATELWELCKKCECVKKRYSGHLAGSIESIADELKVHPDLLLIHLKILKIPILDHMPTPDDKPPFIGTNNSGKLWVNF